MSLFKSVHDSPGLFYRNQVMVLRDDAVEMRFSALSLNLTSKVLYFPNSTPDEEKKKHLHQIILMDESRKSDTKVNTCFNSFNLETQTKLFVGLIPLLPLFPPSFSPLSLTHTDTHTLKNAFLLSALQTNNKSSSPLLYVSATLTRSHVWYSSAHGIWEEWHCSKFPLCLFTLKKL